MNEGRVSYAGKRVYIGIDVHRAFFVASCICEGDVVKRCRLLATGRAVISLIAKWFPESEVRTCYEAGYSGFWLHRELESAGIRNIVVHPAAIKVAANDRVKTDKRDSLKMAQQLSSGQLRGVRVPSKEEEYRRLLARTREQLIRARRRIQAQIRMRLHQFGLLPEELRGVLRLKDARQILATIDGELQFSIERLCAVWEHLEAELKRINQRLVEQAGADPLDAIYRSVPGIGPLASRVLSNELGDMSRFPNVKALYSFTGLTPGEYSSGNSVHRGHISRQGNSRLRYVLVEAAWKAIRKDKSLLAQFERIAKTSGKKRAIVAVARRLAGKIRAVARGQTTYAVEHKQAA
jgi:transposase